MFYVSQHKKKLIEDIWTNNETNLFHTELLKWDKVMIWLLTFNYLPELSAKLLTTKYFPFNFIVKFVNFVIQFFVDN